MMVIMSDISVEGTDQSDGFSIVRWNGRVGYVRRDWHVLPNGTRTLYWFICDMLHRSIPDGDVYMTREDAANHLYWMWTHRNGVD